MHDDSDDDDMPVKSAGTSSVVSPTLKVEQDPGSNEFVNVIAPEDGEVAVKGPENEARTLPVEEILKPVEKLAEPISPILDNDASTNAPIFTNEMPLQLEPESMMETEQTEPLGVRRGDDDGPQMPGSFDMSTTSPQKQMSWFDMLKNLGL